MTESIFRLKDNRKLSYAIYGPDQGQPVLYFHGTPSSRREPLLLNAFGINLASLLEEAGTRLIAVDRPGMGLSGFNPKGDFLSFAEDAAQLAAHLGISSCPVLCWSGGGPYALAMAHRFPRLISGVFILCGFSRPFNREVFRQMGLNKWYFRFAKYAPRLLRTVMYLVSRKNLKRLVPQTLTGLPYVDYAMLAPPEGLKAVANNTLKEACRTSTRGPVYDARSYYRDFGFSLSEITQPVHYWWGTLDMAVVRVHAEAVELEVPNALMHYHIAEGHLSMYVKGFPEALQVISHLHEAST